MASRYFGSDAHHQDRTDVIRYAMDLREQKVLDPDSFRVVNSMLMGADGYEEFRPQAVAQALVSFQVNRRAGRVSAPARYIEAAVIIQQQRLFGKKRDKQ